MGGTWNKKYSKMTINWNAKLDIKTVRRLMRRNQISINTIFYKKFHSGKRRTTFLQHALETRNVRLLNWLIARKVDPNISPRNTKSPIFLAFLFKDYVTVRKLVRLGARLNIRRPGDGRTPLGLAYFNDDNSIAKFLIKNGADVNMEVTTSRFWKGESPLQIFALKGDIEVTKLLISEGADVHHKSANGFTPLICASASHLEIVKLLVDLGADINHKSKDGITPLIYAVQSSELDIVKFLLDCGADIKCITNNGYTPLIGASRFGNLDKIKLLIDYGAEIDGADERDDDVLTPLHNALWSRKVDFLEFFFDLYETISPAEILTGKKKQSLLHYAYRMGLTINGVIDFLLDVGVDVNLVDRDDKLAIDCKSRYNPEEDYLEMRKHFVKLLSANLPVCQRNEDAIGDGLEDFAVDCREEVIKMKNTKIGDVYTTFYDVLQVSKQKLAVKVKFLLSDYQNKEKLREIFPQYGGMLFYKLSEAQKRMKRREKAEEQLDEIFMCCHLPYDFFRELLNYLNEVDLRIIIGETIPNLSKILSL